MDVLRKSSYIHDTKEKIPTNIILDLEKLSTPYQRTWQISVLLYKTLDLQRRHIHSTGVQNESQQQIIGTSFVQTTPSFPGSLRVSRQTGMERGGHGVLLKIGILIINSNVFQRLRTLRLNYQIMKHIKIGVITQK